MSYILLLNDDKLNDKNSALRLKDTEKMKKETKGKRCVLDQDKDITTNLASLFDDEDDACDNIKRRMFMRLNLKK